MLELVVKKQIERYLEYNSIITERQSEFRKQHSCQTAIHIVIDEWKLEVSRENGRNNIYGSQVCIRNNRYNKISDKIVSTKLTIWYTRNCTEWVLMYLSDRTQQVQFNNCWSKLINTKYQISQGSALGLLLFITYMNDIVKLCPEECNIKMFANNTLIYVGGSCEEIINELNVVFKVIERWMNVNKLKLNVSKMKYIYNN